MSDVLAAALGPALLSLLNDPELTDVHLNEDGSVVTEGVGGSRLRSATTTQGERERTALVIAGLDDRILTEREPLFDSTVRSLGVRVSGAVAPVSQGVQLTFRKAPMVPPTLADYVDQGGLTETSEAAIRGLFIDGRATGVIAGATGSGKTTFANALLGALEVAAPLGRLVVIEEGTQEVRLSSPNVVRWVTRGDVTVSDLVRQALRQKPWRVIVGEARGGEAWDWLRLCNTGHPGGLLTLHANSAQDSLERLEDMAREAGVSASLRRLCRTVQWIAFLQFQGVYRAELTEVSWDDVEGRPTFRRIE